MRFLSNEKISPHKYKTPEGYLICVDSILARTGKQTYTRNEIYGDSCDDGDSEVEVSRSANEVFSPATLASFENKPLVVEHPDEDVNVDNYGTYSVGFVRDIKRGKTEDGQEVMLGTLVITDAQTIDEVEKGEHTDISCGYDCDITDGKNPSQINIRGNHIALCREGRAGIAKIVDSTLPKMPEAQRKKIANYFSMISTFTRRDMDIQDIIKPLYGKGFKPVNEKVVGWFQLPDGQYRKDYFFTFENYRNKFMVSLYSGEGKVREVNAYFTDSVSDPTSKKVSKNIYKFTDNGIKTYIEAENLEDALEQYRDLK